jgi:hypothetical protein
LSPFEQSTLFEFVEGAAPTPSPVRQSTSGGYGTKSNPAVSSFGQTATGGFGEGTTSTPSLDDLNPILTELSIH